MSDTDRRLRDIQSKDHIIAEQRAELDRLQSELAGVKAEASYAVAVEWMDKFRVAARGNAEGRRAEATIERLKEELDESLRDTLAARAARDDTIGRNIQLQTELTETIAALQSLHDWQNGPPLQTPKRLEGWGDAMARARGVLNAAAAKEK